MVTSRALTKFFQIFLDTEISVTEIYVIFVSFEIGCSGNF